MRTKLWQIVGAAALSLAAAGCDVPIAQDLQENEANRAVLALEHQGIAAEKTPSLEGGGRWQLSVQRTEAARAISVLARQNLPAESTPGILEALGEGSLVPSRTAEHAKLVQGTAGELERSLRAVDGVIGARVHLAIPVKDALAIESRPEPVSASVLLRHHGTVAPMALADVQSLVAGAVAGLDAERVTVVTSAMPQAAPGRIAKLAQLGPIAVAPGSLGTLRLVLVSVLLTHLALLAAVALLWVKLRRLRSDNEPSENRPADHAPLAS